MVIVGNWGILITAQVFNGKTHYVLVSADPLS